MIRHLRQPDEYKRERLRARALEKERRQVSGYALLPVQKAAELLNFKEEQQAIDWILSLGILRVVDGKRVVLWRDVVAATASKDVEPPPGSESHTTISTADAAKQLGIARCTLDEMVARAPRTLPGAPTFIGRGKQRRHLRWNPMQLEVWAAGYREWWATRGRRR